MAADEYIIRNEYEIASEGPVLGVCVDFIVLGDCVDQYQNQAPHVVPKGALVFQIEELNKQTGKRFEPSIELTLSFGNKAALRKFLEQWRGKPYTDEEARKGAPLHKLVGQSGILTIVHKTSGSGRTYAKIGNITPLMKGMEKLTPVDYERGDHWEKRKQEYAEKVRAFYGEQERHVDAANAAAATVPAADDDLPF